jgi:hypothetical protein
MMRSAPRTGRSAMAFMHVLMTVFPHRAGLKLIAR